MLYIVGACMCVLFLASYLRWRYYGGFYFDYVWLFLVSSYSCCLETLVVYVCVLCHYVFGVFLFLLFGDFGCVCVLCHYVFDGM